MRLYAGCLAVTALLVAGCSGHPATVAPAPTTMATRVPGSVATPTPELPPQYVHMLTATQGWGVDGDAVVRTRDGGATWRNVTPSDVPEGATLQDGFFLNADDGWVPFAYPGVLGGGLLRTSDGGATWSMTVLVPASGRGYFVDGRIDFITAAQGWMVVGHGGAAGSEGVDIYGSTDGGATWAQLSGATAAADPPPGSLPLGGMKTGPVFLDAEDGWITGFTASEGDPYLFRSTDGGRTWHQQPLPAPPGIDFAQAQISVAPPRFFSAHDGVLTAEPGRATVIYTTRDGGATWQVGAVAPRRTGIRFLSMSAGWALDPAATTADGGRHWTSLALPAGFAGGDSVAFVMPQAGFAWSSPADRARTLWRTDDGGRSWEEVHPSLARRP